MQIGIRQYEQRDAAQAAEIWNEVVEDGKAFPQLEKRIIARMRKDILKYSAF